MCAITATLSSSALPFAHRHPHGLNPSKRGEPLEPARAERSRSWPGRKPGWSRACNSAGGGLTALKPGFVSVGSICRTSVLAPPTTTDANWTGTAGASRPVAWRSSAAESENAGSSPVRFCTTSGREKRLDPMSAWDSAGLAIPRCSVANLPVVRPSFPASHSERLVPPSGSAALPIQIRLGSPASPHSCGIGSFFAEASTFTTSAGRGARSPKRLYRLDIDSDPCGRNDRQVVTQPVSWTIVHAPCVLRRVVS